MAGGARSALAALAACTAIELVARVLVAWTFRSPSVVVAQFAGLVVVLSLLYWTWRGSRRAWLVVLVLVVPLPVLGLLGRQFDGVSIAVLAASAAQLGLLTLPAVRCRVAPSPGAPAR